MPFRFKYFEVEDENSTLRVNTDAMLLGSWAEPGNARSILDIGTGCGILALMMAQKSNALIHAIDIDPASVEQARQNFLKSPWGDRITPRLISLQELASSVKNSYDYILSNPPFFYRSLRSPSERKNRTKHQTEMSRSNLLDGVSKLLEKNTKFSLILPASFENGFKADASAYGLYPFRSLKISSIEDHPPKRVLLEFSTRNASPETCGSMFILDKNHTYSESYLQLTSEFHQF